MPELPEVETIRRQLDAAVRDDVIKSIDVRFGERLNVPAKVFMKTVAGARVLGVGRRAKLLLIHLANGWTLVCHLKLTGRFLLKTAQDRPGKHDHLVFHLKSGRRLFFEDVRKFGYVRLHRTADLERGVFAKEKYGPEPLEMTFSPDVFASCLRRRGSRRVKQALMDQTCVAGIGNIYADESLWRARVRPGRRVKSLKGEEFRRLYRGVIDSLRESIRLRGTSADDYLDLYGQAGKYAERLHAYGREGERCSRCGGLIAKTRLAGRGTHFCPKCQV